MTATMLLWRHGQTDFNAQRRLQGQVDIPLNEVGLEQARAAAPILASVEPAAIVSSDLERAHQTAAELAQVTGLTIRTDQRLRERNYGRWEGLTHPEISADWPSEFARWQRGQSLPETIGAETRTDLGHRVAQAVTDIAQEHDTGDVVVLVTHGGSIGSGITTLLGQDPGEWQAISGIGNCHWSVLQPSRRGELAWRLTGHNCGGPLTDFPQGAAIV